MVKKYLDFVIAGNKGKKTKRFHIFNKVTGDCLGEIKWDTGWRQYVSSCQTDGYEELVFSAGCHIELAEFIKELMEERKVGGKRK